MLEVFLVQLLAAALGVASTASADRLYHSGRISKGLHSFCVSASIAVICLPVLAWTSGVFLGSGVLGQLVAGLVVGSIFIVQKSAKTPFGAEFGILPASAAPLERTNSPGIKSLRCRDAHWCIFLTAAIFCGDVLRL